jgi:DNA-binding transcriptional ArsR family regulator
VFTEIFGDSPRVKLLDFLADHVDFDYTISQIQGFTDISRPTIYRLIEELKTEKMISVTREVGASKFYGLNTQDDKVIGMLQLEFEAINKSLVERAGMPPRAPSAQSIELPAGRDTPREHRRVVLLMSRRPEATTVKFKKGKRKSRR